jgi:hypothetical protein
MAAMPVATAVVPMHLLGLELRGLIAGGDGGMGVRIAFWISLRHAGITERLRRQRRGLCGGSERGSSRGDTECEFQKIAAFHDIFLLGDRFMMRRQCRAHDMNCG